MMQVVKVDVGSIDSVELLSYAQRVAKHTLQPLESPIPQDHHMRMSLLFQQAKVQQQETGIIV